VSAAVGGRPATMRQLDLIRIVAIADFLLLIPLLLNVFGVIHSDTMVSVIGPIHGIGFVVLIWLCARGVAEGRWGWWFPAVVVATLGPIGSLWGEHRIRRKLTAGSPAR
jgi:integral membrane protein